LPPWRVSKVTKRWDSQGQDPALKVTMAGFGCSVYQVVNLYESTPRPTPGPPFDPPPPFPPPLRRNGPVLRGGKAVVSLAA
jgi:hypothetical protein